MADLHKSGTRQQDQLAILRCVLQRIAQAERPLDFAITKQVLLARLRELQEETASTLLATNARLSD